MKNKVLQRQLADKQQTEAELQRQLLEKQQAEHGWQLQLTDQQQADGQLRLHAEALQRDHRQQLLDMQAAFEKQLSDKTVEIVALQQQFNEISSSSSIVSSITHSKANSL